MIEKRDDQGLRSGLGLSSLQVTTSARAKEGDCNASSVIHAANAAGHMRRNSGTVDGGGTGSRARRGVSDQPMRKRQNQERAPGLQCDAESLEPVGLASGQRRA